MPEVVHNEVDPEHDSKSGIAALPEVEKYKAPIENSSSDGKIEVNNCIFSLIAIGFCVYLGFFGILIEDFPKRRAKETMFHYNIRIYINTGVLGLTNDYSDYWLYFFDVADIIRNGYGGITTKVTTDPPFLRIQNFLWHGNNTETCYRLIGKSGAVLTEDQDCLFLNGTEFYYKFRYISFLKGGQRFSRNCTIRYESFKTSNGSSNTTSLHYGRFRYFRHYTGEYSGLDVLANDSWITWNKLVEGCEEEIYIQRLFTYDEYYVRFSRSYDSYKFHLADDLYDVDIKREHRCLRDVPMPKGSTYRIKSPPFCLILSLSLCTYYLG